MATLRYSPRNWTVVNWPFSTCSLPEPQPCPTDPEETTPACPRKPVLVYPDTYDWARFLPEVMVGIEAPDQDIAANYVRQAAIEFARDAHVLQRELVIDLEKGIDDYQLFSFPGERVAGVLMIALGDACDCSCASAGLSGRSTHGFFWTVDVSRGVLRLQGQPQRGRLTITVWATPTEDACAYDRFLYDAFRSEITLGARRYFVLAAHFRDRALMATIVPPSYWDRVILASLRQAHRVPTARETNKGSGMWVGGRGGGRGSF